MKNEDQILLEIFNEMNVDKKEVLAKLKEKIKEAAAISKKLKSLRKKNVINLPETTEFLDKLNGDRFFLSQDGSYNLSVIHQLLSLKVKPDIRVKLAVYNVLRGTPYEQQELNSKNRLYYPALNSYMMVVCKLVKNG